MSIYVAFDSDFTGALLDKSLGLKYFKGNGTATWTDKRCTGVLLTATTW